jgi:hypothetical protein
MLPPIGMVRSVFSAIAACAIALVAGCQSGSSTPFPDAVPLPDAAVGVLCAQALCSTQFGCCTGGGGAAPSCMTSSTEACAGKILKCDGPEDCTGGSICCVLNAGGTACQTTTQCEGDGTIACNGDNECPSDLPACCNHICGSQCNFW